MLLAAAAETFCGFTMETLKNENQQFHRGSLQKMNDWRNSSEHCFINDN